MDHVCQMKMKTLWSSRQGSPTMLGHEPRPSAVYNSREGGYCRQMRRCNSRIEADSARTCTQSLLSRTDTASMEILHGMRAKLEPCSWAQSVPSQWAMGLAPILYSGAHVFASCSLMVRLHNTRLWHLLLRDAAHQGSSQSAGTAYVRRVTISEHVSTLL